MRRTMTFFVLLIMSCVKLQAEYTDHRGHNVDSLETVMAAWTAKDLAEADEQALRHVADDLEELMWGFNQTNGVKSEYYARMLLGIAQSHGWLHKIQASAKGIGQHFWAKEQYDSAAFYYTIAMEAVEKMSVVPDGGDGPAYTEKSIDDALSQMYGTLGNLYSMMDSIPVAMDYYEKAGVLFKKHEWNNSCSVLYYNMGETMRVEDDLASAEKYYKESLKYSLLTGDSLAIATVYKGLGSLYLEMGRTNRAMHYLDDANSYFADHEKEELQYRMESLDYTGQVLALLNKRLKLTMLLLVAALLLMALALVVARKLKQARKENSELSEVLEETVAEIAVPEHKTDIRLKPREMEVLDLIAKGYTNAAIADALCLSPETIKWYKKKLFAMFDASNSAELVTIAKDEGIL